MVPQANSAKQHDFSLPSYFTLKVSQKKKNYFRACTVAVWWCRLFCLYTDHEIFSEAPEQLLMPLMTHTNLSDN